MWRGKTPATSYSKFLLTGPTHSPTKIYKSSAKFANCPPWQVKVILIPLRHTSARKNVIFHPRPNKSCQTLLGKKPWLSIISVFLQRAMDESGESNFLIDGFPRNDENLNGWNASTLAEKVSYNYSYNYSYSFNTIGKS